MAEASPSGGQALSSSCALPETVFAPLVIGAHCNVALGRTRVVAPATLTIEGGAHVVVGSQSRITVEHGATLVLSGSSAEPAVLGQNSVVWCGIESFGYLRMMNAGVYAKSLCSETTSLVKNSGGVVSIEDTSISLESGLALELLEDTAAHTVKTSSISGAPQSARIAANVLGRVASSTRFGSPVSTGGWVRTSQTWPTLSVPLDLASKSGTMALQLDGTSAIARLELRTPTVLRFGVDCVFGIGNGELVAHGSEFTAIPAVPVSSWGGIGCSSSAAQIDLADVKIRHVRSGFAALRLEARPLSPSVRLARVTFQNNLGPSIEAPPVGCSKSILSGLSAAGVVSIGQPICVAREPD